MSIIKKMSDYWTILNFWVGLTGITGFRYNLTPCFIDHHRRSYTQGSAHSSETGKNPFNPLSCYFFGYLLGQQKTPWLSGYGMTGST
jgi:hypothetical protein